MDVFRQTVFPLLLGSGAVLALLRELATFRDSSGASRVYRLLRRGTSCVLIVFIAVLLSHGRTDASHLAPAQAVRTFYYWGAVLLLACATVALAVLDAVLSFRALEFELMAAQNEEIKRLRQQIVASQPELPNDS